MYHLRTSASTFCLLAGICSSASMLAQYAPVRPSSSAGMAPVPCSTATSPSSGNITVRMTDGLDSGSEKVGDYSEAVVTRSTIAAVPAGSQAIVQLSVDAKAGGFGMQLQQLRVGNAVMCTASSSAVLAGGWAARMNNKLRVPGAPRDAVSGARVFVPEATDVEFTLMTPLAEALPTPIAPSASSLRAKSQTSPAPVAQPTADQKIDFTLSNIGLSMTLAQVKAKLGPSAQYQITHYKDPALELLQASKGKRPPAPSETLQIFTVMLLDDRVVYLRRSIAFGSQVEPNFNATAQQLLDKFGSPTKLFGTARLSGDYLWEYGQDSLLLSPAGFEAINIDCPYQGRQPTPQIPVGGDEGAVPSTFYKGCYRQAMSSMTPGLDNSQLVRYLEVTLEDQVPLYEHDSRIEQQQQQSVRQAAKDAEKRKAPM